MKIDVEGAEYLALEQALNDGFLQRNVKQLLLEWHIRPFVVRHNRWALRKMLEIYTRLQESGFKIFYHGSNHNRIGSIVFLPFTAHVNTFLQQQQQQQNEDKVDS